MGIGFTFAASVINRLVREDTPCTAMRALAAVNGLTTADALRVLEGKLTFVDTEGGISFEESNLPPVGWLA